MTSGKYQQHRSLPTGHTEPLNTVRFSDDGVYMATGSDDCWVKIWSVDKWTLTQTLDPGLGPVTAAEWLCQGSVHWLIVGGASGSVQLWKSSLGQASLRYSIIEQPFDYMAMYAVFDPQIEAIAIRGAQGALAIVGRGRLALLRLTWDEPGLNVTSRQLEPSLLSPAGTSLARSVHFFNSGKSLMVGHLDSKQMVAWNIDPWARLWTQTFRKPIGGTAWSPETRRLLIWNLDDGVDVYQLQQSGRLLHVILLKVEVKHYFPKLLGFGQQGKLALFGGDMGDVYVWDIDSGNLLQTLAHGSRYFPDRASLPA
ncbi:WD40-repeat-containing domain protein [Amylostereum chailletii]|nr:WD40-repeat-containing domain protein [Amylostereum chailletii]